MYTEVFIIQLYANSKLKNITSQQVNYDDCRPYAGEKKCEFHQSEMVFR